MALRFIDSAAHYNTLAPKWTGNFFADAMSSGGRRDQPWVRVIGGGFAKKTLTHQNRYICGAAVKYISGLGANLTLFNDALAVAQLVVNDDSTISLFCGLNRAGVSNVAVPFAGSFHYYEMDCTVSGGTGPVLCTATIRVDERPYGTFTGTCNFSGSALLLGTADVNVVGVASNGTFGFMDYYCLDTNTTDANGNASTCTGFMGDVEIDALFPDADVAIGMSTFGGDGTHAYTCINQHAPDDDTSYIVTSNTGSSATFNHEPITGFTGTIMGAQYVSYARKDSEGLRAFVNLVGGSAVATIEALGTDNYLSDYYIYYCSPLDTDNGVAWTTGAYDAESFGVKLKI